MRSGIATSRAAPALSSARAASPAARTIRASHPQARPELDPFGEHVEGVATRRVQLLGARFEFRSASEELLRLVDTAYAGLPRHRLATSPRLQLALRLTDGVASRRPRGEPPQVSTQGGAGMFCGMVDAASWAVVCPAIRSGLVTISREQLRFPYHARYELLEFAVFTLASRAQGLAPLHAGCVGSGGRGVLLLGDSGAGKSTLALHCMLQGLDLLAEDAVFIAPRTLAATGVANFLHLRDDALRWIDDESLAAAVRSSPTIRRRSGVAKREVDVRRAPFRLARASLRIAAVVFLSSSRGATRARGAAPVPRAIGRRQLLDRLAATQPYAARLPTWRDFAAEIARVPAFELARGSHPRATAAVVREILGGAPRRAARAPPQRAARP
jgi:hypothetical protein